MTDGVDVIRSSIEVTGGRERSYRGIRRMTDTDGKLGEDGKVHYTELNANIRHYSGLRYAVLSAYMVLVGVVGTMGPTAPPMDTRYAWWYCAVGVVTIFLLSGMGLILEARISNVLNSFKDSARDLEKGPDLRMWRNIVQSRFGTHWVFNGMFAGIGVLSLCAWILKFLSTSEP